MRQQKAAFQIKGMTRDLADSKFSPEFAFENYNIRITPTDGSTLLVLTNEKGNTAISHTAQTKIIDGHTYTETTRNIIGYAVLYKTIVLFEHNEYRYNNIPANVDCIATLEYNGTSFVETYLFKGDLNFDCESPIETLPLYEAQDIQKVYWVDGRNQPRVINISNDADHLIDPDDNSQFDFLVSLNLQETASATLNTNVLGQFPGGVLQYGFTYSKRNGQESKLVWFSNLLYTTFYGDTPANNRAAGPDEITPSSYDINIQNADSNFDYINIYSVLRTSKDGGLIAKLVTKIDILQSEPSGGYTYTDTNTSGQIIDPVELLYKGGEKFIAGTLATKDNTLFLGNIEYTGNKVSSDIINYAQQMTVGETTSEIPNWYESSGFYSYKNPLLQPRQTYLRAGNKYRFGVQLQDVNGAWSEPIFVMDKVTETRPQINGTSLLLPQPYINLSTNFLSSASTAGYKKVRPVIVYPNVNERGVIAQGVVCPTVFSPENRNANNPFVQSSWFFRPYNAYGYDATDANTKFSLEARHLHTLPNASRYNAEIQCSKATDTWATKTDTSLLTTKDFFIDGSIVTFYSPDVNDNLQETLLANSNLKIVGALAIDSLAGRCIMSTGAAKDAVNGGKVSPGIFNVDKSIGASTWDRNVFSTQTLWKDIPIADSQHFATYPWHRNKLGWDDGFVYGNGYGDLISKTLSNIRYSQLFQYYNSAGEYSLPYGLRDKRIFREANGDSSLMLTPPNNLNSLITAGSTLYYKGTYTRPIIPDSEYSVLHADQFDGALLNTIHDGGFEVQDAVYIQYRSTDHIVLALENTPTGRTSELPVPVFATTDPTGEKTQSQYTGHAYWLEDSDNNAVEIYSPTAAVNAILSGEEESFLDTSPADNTLVLVISPASGTGNFPWTITAKQVSSSQLVASQIYPYTYNVFNLSSVTQSLVVSSLGIINAHPAVVVSTADSGQTWTATGDYSAGSDTPTKYLPNNILSAANSKEEVMWITELYRQIPAGIFGGNTEYAIRNNEWLPCGEAVVLPQSASQLPITEGDTVFNRWDCVKTLPYATEDVNQVVEILSFMCESYVNTAGRYDKNRGQQDYTFLNSSTPFNQINDAYNNKDNFFKYRVVDTQRVNDSWYPNQITWSTTKTLGEEIDSWTSMSLGATLGLDGDKGVVRAIRRWKNSLFAFQDKGVAEILFNPSAAIATSAGVPIEIANSGKVEGKRYISESIGCTNKWSICITSQGLYFVDSIDRKIYAWTDEGMICLTEQLGFTSWVNNTLGGTVEEKFDPSSLSSSDIITEYDRSVGDVYFITKDVCLAFNERLKQFTSFYNYENTPFFINLDNKCIAVHNGQLWDQHAGNYNNYFGITKPYSVEVVVNPSPTEDKVFTNVDFRADSWSGDVLRADTFDRLTVWDEFQKGIQSLSNTLDRPSTLKKKFRIWHANIPRNSTNQGGDATHNYRRDRIRNTWAHLKLSKESPGTERTTLHDLVVTYYI